MHSPLIEIAGRPVGRDHPPLFWPDIDVYFKNDRRSAMALIDAIAETGGGFLKAALLHRPDLAAPLGTVSYFDATSGMRTTERYRDVVERHYVTLDDMQGLLAYGRDRGLALVLSIYDQAGLDFAVSESTAAIKIPSSNITHPALIRSAADSGLPLVLDTGRSSMAEIDRAVSWVRQTNADCALLVQHSPPSPPATPGAFHMNMLTEFERRFAVPTGLSDHAAGPEMIPIAVALGASVIEKGLTVSRDHDIDMAHAMELDQLEGVFTLIRDSWQALGQMQRPSSDVPPSPSDRMGCFARRDLPTGHLISLDDIQFMFPAAGLRAEAIDQIVGQILKAPLMAGAPINADHLTLKS